MFTIGLIFVTFCNPIFPESPLFLMSRGKYEEARESFNKIANFNHRPLLKDENYLMKLLEQKEDESRKNFAGSVFAMLKDKYTKRNLILLTLIYTAALLDYYILCFIVVRLSGNPFTNSIVSSCADCIAMAFSALIVFKIGVKPGIRFFFFLSLIAGAILVQVNNGQISIILLILFAKFGNAGGKNSICVSFQQFIPVIYLGSAFEFFFNFSRITASLAPHIAFMNH